MYILRPNSTNPNVSLLRSYEGTWPSGKLPFDCQKIVKNLTFFQKNWQKLIFVNFFLKKMLRFCQFFDIQLAIFRRVRLDVPVLPCLISCSTPPALGSSWSGQPLVGRRGADCRAHSCQKSRRTEEIHWPAFLGSISADFNWKKYFHQIHLNINIY